MKIVLLKILFLLLCFVALLMLVDTAVFYEYISNINIGWVIVSFIFILLNQLISSVRFDFMLRAFGSSIGLWNAHRINIYSIFSGILFFNFFGQSISRSFLVRKIDKSEVSFFVTAIERSISFSVLLVFSLALSVYVFGGGEVYVPSTPILMIFGFVLSSSLLFYFVVLFPRQRAEVNVFLAGGVGKRIWGVVFLVVLMHLSMLCAYVSLMLGMSGNVAVNESSILANLLAMLGGTLPISFGGWGVREVSAGFAFKAASLPSELGISAGIGIGVLTLVALSLNLVIIAFLRKKGAFLQSVPERKNQGIYSKRLILLLSWVSLPIIIVLMMVQVPVPMASGKLAVNLADPFAIVTGMTFVLVLLQKRAWSEVWFDRRISYWLILAGCVLLLSYFVGLVKFGYSEWALYNRLIGSGVLFAYLVIGLVSVAFWGRFAIRVALRTVFVTVPLIAVIEFLFRFGMGYSELLSLGWHTPRWTGFLSNPNSYAFFLITLFCIAFAFGQYEFRAGLKLTKILPLSIIITLVFLTASRAGLLSLVLISLMFSFVDWRRISCSVILGFALYLSILGFNKIFLFTAESTSGVTQFDRMRSHLSVIQIDRLNSLVDGWEMFLNNPILGAGLGAFHHSQSLNGTPLVLHNSYLWILAEMGMIGFVVIVLFPLIFFGKLFLKYEWKYNPYMCVFLAILTNFAVMGMAHELVYQRIFWLSFGMLLANPFKLRSKSIN